MLVALQHQEDNKTRTIAFTQRRATLPYLSQQGIALLPWGRRHYEHCTLPVGACCRMDLLKSDAWDTWFPRRVLIPASTFCVLDCLGKAHWFTVSAGEFVQAVIAKTAQQQRLYVCMATTQRWDNIFWYWPVLIRRPRLYDITNR